MGGWGGGTIKWNNNEQNTSITLQCVLQTSVRYRLTFVALTTPTEHTAWRNVTHFFLIKHQIRCHSILVEFNWWPHITANREHTTPRWSSKQYSDRASLLTNPAKVPSDLLSALNVYSYWLADRKVGSKGHMKERMASHSTVSKEPLLQQLRIVVFQPTTAQTGY